MKHFLFTLRLVDFPNQSVRNSQEIIVFFGCFLKDKSTLCWMMMDAGNIRILTSPAKKLTTQKHAGRQKLFKANWREMSPRKKEEKQNFSLCSLLRVWKSRISSRGVNQVGRWSFWPLMRWRFFQMLLCYYYVTQIKMGAIMLGKLKK